MADGRLATLRGRLPASPCYVCRSCSVIVGFPEHQVSHALAIIPDIFLLTRVYIGTVLVEFNSSFERGLYRMVTLYCGLCLSFLGWKIEQSAGPLSVYFAAGRFIIFARFIHLWDGRNLLDPVWRPDNSIAS